MRLKQTLVAMLASAILGAALPAAGADLKIISTGNVRHMLPEFQRAFESDGAHKITFSVQGAAATRKLVEGGAQGDAMIGPRFMLEALQTQGRIKPGSIVDFARSSMGVVMRTGAAAPDISTDEKFRQFLLDAESLVYPDPDKGSLGGNYLTGLIGQWGIADRIKSKSLLVDGGDVTAHFVADGKARFGLNQIAEIAKVQGLTFLEPLPPVLTNKIVMSAAVLAGSKEPGAAGAWVAFLASSKAAPVIEHHGMAAGTRP